MRVRKRIPKMSLHARTIMTVPWDIFGSGVTDARPYIKPNTISPCQNHFLFLGVIFTKFSARVRNLFLKIFLHAQIIPFVPGVIFVALVYERAFVN